VGSLIRARPIIFLALFFSVTRTGVGAEVINPAGPMPPIFKWYMLIFIGLLLLGAIGGLLIRVIPVGIAEYGDVLKAFAEREISTSQLPSEFHFITHETTLQQVIDRLGPCSRVVRLPIDPKSGLGYGFVPTKLGGAAIIAFEYHLPYHAAAIVMPEYPFEPQNRIRAAFYRPLQVDLSHAIER
jgi:hypothetical protein